MRIGIITLPFLFNYGGIIQAYALQKVLISLGHDVFILEHESVVPRRLSIKIRYLIYIKRFVRKYLLGQRDIVIFEDKKNRERVLRAIQNNRQFIDSHMIIRNFNIDRACETYNYDCYVVGSDQVWRPKYTNPVEKYFLNFLKPDSPVLRIAYGASFGTDDWEFSEQQTVTCATLAQRFDLITVREKSGVTLCERYLHVKAKQVLDPTMLLDRDDYINIIKKDHIPHHAGNLFVYMLDDNICKQEFVKKISNVLGMSSFSVVPTQLGILGGTVYPGVSSWLRGFFDADFVVTDSFHGCVFSIIFNIPFVVIGNLSRGQARFDSLLALFNLQDRLVDVDNMSIRCLSQSINWIEVNSIWDTMREHSMEILANALIDN